MSFVDQESCLYLYAILDMSAPSFPRSGQTDISLIQFRDIACAVTRVSTSEYCKELPSQTPEQVDWIAPRAMKHHRVLMDMMASSTIVPFKFGMLCASEDDLRRMLNDRYEQFKTLLERLRGKDEWAISIYVECPSLLEHLERAEQQLRELDALIAQKSGGEVYLLRKKKEKLTDSLLNDTLALMRHKCCERLQGCTELLFEGQSGSIGDERLLVLAATVLSARTEFELLKQGLSEIENDYFRYSASVCLSGPWPAYRAVNTMLANT